MQFSRFPADILSVFRTVLVAICVVLGAMMLIDALGSARRTPVPAAGTANGGSSAASAHVATPGAAPSRPAPAIPPPPAPVQMSVPASTAISSLDLYARLATRRRIAREGARVYLDSSFAHTDSTVVRWDGRDQLGVAFVVDSTLPGWSASVVDDARAGMNLWDGNGAGIILHEVAPGSTADITVQWATRLPDSTQAGVTQVNWGPNGVISSAAVTLALRHGADLSAIPSDARRRFAGHEFGHALGLPHSDDRDDLMFPTSPVAAPSFRDQSTLRLLYAIAPGPLRVPY